MSEGTLSSADGTLTGEQVRDRVEEALAAKGYKFSRAEGQNSIVLLFTGKRYDLRCWIYCGSNYLSFHASLPMVLEKECHATMLELLNKLSYRIPVGGFEIYSDLGRIRFKVGMIIPPVPSLDGIESLLLLCISSIDRATDEIDRVIAGCRAGFSSGA